MRPPWRAGGLVLLSLLIALLLIAIAMQGALDVWALQRQRLQEEELLFVGDQYRLAIQRYYLAGRTLPASIDDLVEDKRFAVPMHHLRRAYPDPVTGRNDWRFLRDGDRIFGVYSKSEAAPIKRAHFPLRYADFAEAKTYGQWRFAYLPPGRWMRDTPAPGAQPDVPAPATGEGNTTPRIPRMPGGRAR